MIQPSPSPDQNALRDIGARHGFGLGATASMLDALIAGGGGMAQFSHPEFGGAGQWMRGGMTMVSDMFDSQLRSRVDALCRDLATLVAHQTGSTQGGGFQSQHQGGRDRWQLQDRIRAGAAGDEPRRHAESGEDLPVSASSGRRWWPASLGAPDSVGAQNGTAYAYFAQARRLAIFAGGRVTVHDTLDHRIDGFSQQQPDRDEPNFRSQHGDVDVSTLPVVSSSAEPARSSSHGETETGMPRADVAQPSGRDSDPFAAIEKLASLKAAGAISDAEFAAKKAELLRRI
jgi:hypothetical protein